MYRCRYNHIAVSYTHLDVYKRQFLDKISDYKLLNYEDYLVDELAVGYMKRVCTKFDKICQADLSQQDDNEYAFLSDEIDDEIIDIVTDGMVVEWLRQYVNNSDNLENLSLIHI